MAQGYVVAVDLDRDARRGEGPAHAGDGAGAGAYQDGHVGPGDAVLQVCPAEDVGDVVEFGAGGREGEGVDAPPGAYGRQIAVGAYGGGREAGEGHAAGEEAGGGQQVRAGAPGGGEDLDGRRGAVDTGKGVREVEDAVDVAAAEGVDRLVRVAEGDEGTAVPRQGAQQPQLGRVRVLVLVHVDRVVPGGQLRGHLRAFGQQHGPVHELRVVQHPARVQHVQVLREEGRRRTPVRAARAAREVGERAGAQPQLAAAREDGAHLVGEPARGQARAQLVGPAHAAAPRALQFGLPGEQFPYGDVLLGAGQQPQRVGEEVGVLVGADQGVAVRMEGRGLRGRRAAAEPGGHPVAQFDGGLAAEGEDEDALRVAAPPYALGDRLDERGRLPGAGPGEDEQGAAGVVNHRALPCVQLRRGHGSRPGAHQAVAAR